MSTIGRQINLQRRANRYSIRGLARKAGIDHATLIRVERGDKEPYFETVRKVAVALGMSIDTLLTIQLKSCPACVDGVIHSPVMVMINPGHWSGTGETNSRPCKLCNGTGVVAYRETGDRIEDHAVE